MTVSRLLEQNRAWVAERTRQDPDYFRREVGRHRPTCLYIGCSDARVPANVITGTEIGELFVHRNIANQVVATDPNLLAIIQYAIDVLDINDIIVCGHEECGGIRAALGPRAPMHVESWLAHVRNVARIHAAKLDAIQDEGQRARALVELNVREQVRNLSLLSVVQDAWRAGRPIRVHGWIYTLADGLLHDLEIGMDAALADYTMSASGAVRDSSSSAPAG